MATGGRGDAAAPVDDAGRRSDLLRRRATRPAAGVDAPTRERPDPRIAAPWWFPPLRARRRSTSLTPTTTLKPPQRRWRRWRWWFRRGTSLAALAARPRARGRRIAQAAAAQAPLPLIMIGLAVLAVISTLFGMLLAVASDLPRLENTKQFATGRTSYLYDDHGRPIGPLLSPDKHEVIDAWKQFSPWMIDAIISLEDKRYWMTRASTSAAWPGPSWPT